MGKAVSVLRSGGKERKTRRLFRRTVSQLERITNFSKTEIKQWHKLFLKDCPNGQLTEEHFVSFYVGSFQSGDSSRKAELATQIFRTFDRDGSGTIDFREFMCGMNVLMRGSISERLKWAFYMYDRDGSGSISTNELLDVLKLMYEIRYPEYGLEELEKTEPQLQMLAERIFQELDDDGNGVLQLKEFVEGIRMKPYLLSMDVEGGRLLIFE
ncbi:neurocalcin homolog [Branchiostoma lanceolatum]|uniref:HPCAL1 protein n=1 Tax=Branchiostoma lanceolatum TaxID=7740 RepID=A0A8J9WH51_BRALA|nr:HPCAL1 [Branchiostoma lanceolatum]